MKRARVKHEPTIPLLPRHTIIPGPQTVVLWFALGLLFFICWLFIALPRQFVCWRSGHDYPDIDYTDEDYFGPPPECRRCGRTHQRD